MYEECNVFRIVLAQCGLGDMKKLHYLYLQELIREDLYFLLSDLSYSHSHEHTEDNNG